MSAIHTTEGVRPIMLPASAAGRRDLAVRIRAAVKAAQRRVSRDSPSYHPGPFECARALAALIEHCPRLYSDALGSEIEDVETLALVSKPATPPAAPPAEVMVPVEAVRARPRLTGSLDDIVAAAALAFDIDRADVRPVGTRPRRFKTHSAARHVAMWCALRRAGWPPLSLPTVGRWFGGFDHTSVLHAVRRIDRAVAEGTDLGAVALQVAEAAGVRLQEPHERDRYATRTPEVRS